MPAFRLPVRQLVEFLLRTGSIDSRFTGFDRANEGARIHRRLQKAAGEGYAAEVYLTAQREVEGLLFVLEGRADGIFQNEDGTVVIDEIKMEEIGKTKEYENLHLTKPGDHTRAYIKVQDGCNQFCTYCIIPYARGRVRSRSMEDVLDEVRTLADNGYKEVVLTGIHLSSYGIDFDKEYHLLELIRAVHEIDGIERIRLGSLEPGIITEKFAEGIAKLPKMCPHFHLSLQSGCDATLKRMNRRYTSSEYAEKCELLRKYFPNPALTTDVIVGFPGETEEEFKESYDFVDSIDFYETHIFKYSRREGTKAAVMPDQVDEQIKAKRSAQLIELGEKKRAAYEQSFQGKEVEVLVEEDLELNGKEVQIGHTKEYMKIALETNENLKNSIVKVQIGKDSQIIH